jgi:hypothetical protein
MRTSKEFTDANLLRQKSAKDANDGVGATRRFSWCAEV